MDNFFNSKKFITCMIVLIICIGLFGCGVKQIKHQEPKQKEPITTVDTIGNMDAMVGVLGCIFGGVCK
tara:strand:- start:1921 stop:2124 length:204 start_codon:yes stop_codon:yes gene_type:complete